MKIPSNSSKVNHQQAIPNSKKFPREQSETAELLAHAARKLEATNETFLRRLSNKEMGLAGRSVTLEPVAGDPYLAAQRVFKRGKSQFSSFRHTNSSPAKVNF